MPPKKNKLGISVKEASDMALGLRESNLGDSQWKQLCKTHYPQYLKNHPKTRSLLEPDVKKTPENPEGKGEIDWQANFKMICIYEKKIMDAATLVIPELKKKDTLADFKRQYGMSDIDWNQIISIHEDAIYEFKEYLNWSAVSKRPFDDKFIPFIAEFLDWKIVSQAHVSDFVIRKYATKLDWKFLSERGLSQTLIREFPDRVHWKRLPALNYTEDFMIEFYDKLRHVEYAPEGDVFLKKINNVNWGTIKTNNLSNKLIIKSKNRINWALNREDLSRRKWKEEFIEEFADNFIWKELPVSHLSPKFINKHKDQINWDELSYEIRSEQFITVFKEFVNWQNLPAKKYKDAFVVKFKDYLYWPKVEVAHLQEDTLITCRKSNMFPWDRVSRKEDLTEDFMRKYQKNLNWESIAHKKHLTKAFKKEFAAKIKPFIKDHMRAVTNVEEQYTKELNNPENQRFLGNYR